MALTNESAGETNQKLLFHGTAALPVEEVLSSEEGLDPRHAGSGFYGTGTYLAESAGYPIGGRYAHRIKGSDGKRVELLMVRAALGAQQDFGTHVDDETRRMRMPGFLPSQGQTARKRCSSMDRASARACHDAHSHRCMPTQTCG